MFGKQEKRAKKLSSLSASHIGSGQLRELHDVEFETETQFCGNDMSRALFCNSHSLNDVDDMKSLSKYSVHEMASLLPLVFSRHDSYFHAHLNVTLIFFSQIQSSREL